MTAGIYKLTFSNGKTYIGSSKNAEKRFKEHRSALSRGRHCNEKLQRAYSKHGEPAFSLVVVCREDDLIMYEQIAMDALTPEYNISAKAGRLVWTDEMRREASAKRKGRSIPSEVVEKVRAALTGRRLSPDHRAKCGNGRRGKPLPDEHRRRLIEANTGRECSADVREKIRAAQAGRKFSDEHLAKIREAHARRRGTKRSPEAVAKMVEKNRGKKRSEESRAKIREAIVEHWKKRKSAG